MKKNIPQLTEEFLQHFFSFNTTTATALGFPGFDDRLPDFSKQNILAQTRKYQHLLALLSQTRTKNFDEEIDSELLERKLKVQIYYLESAQHFLINPALYVSLASDGIFSLMMATHRPQKQQLDFILKRLEDFPRFFEQAKENLQKPVKLWTQIALDEAHGAISYIRETVQNFLQMHKVKSYEALIAKSCQTIFDFIEFLKQIEDTQIQFSIGEDRFRFLLDTFHGIHESPKELRKIGLKQIDVLQQEISNYAGKINAAMPWRELVDDIKKNHPSEQELVNAYKNKVAELKKFLIEKDIVTLPTQESLKIMETPDFLKQSIPYAAYTPPAMFNESGQGIFFVSPPQGKMELLKEHCFASFPLTALHEAYPGHHLQFATQKKLKSPIQKIYDVASYYEGWTLYCEQMMCEQGFCDDPMKFFQLKDRLWRAARVVVDVSMHCFGMNDAEAVDFLVEHAKLSRDGARVDVNWYTQSPTTPLSYLIGTLEVEKIRTDFLNTGKTLKEFHDAFLSCGAIPLSCVKKILFHSN